MNDEKSERERKIDERIFALLSMVEDQEKAVRAALGGLALERAALGTERVALMDQAEKMERLADRLSGTIQQAIPGVAEAASQAADMAVKGALAGTAMTAIHAAGIAAQPTLDGVTAAVKSAAAVQLELKQAVLDFRKEWKWAGTLAIMGMLGAATLITLGSIWLEMEKVDRLLTQKTQLSAEVSALQEQAEQAKRNSISSWSNPRKRWTTPTAECDSAPAIQSWASSCCSRALRT